MSSLEHVLAQIDFRWVRTAFGCTACTCFASVTQKQLSIKFKGKSSSQARGASQHHQSKYVCWACCICCLSPCKQAVPWIAHEGAAESRPECLLPTLTLRPSTRLNVPLSCLHTPRLDMCYTYLQHVGAGSGSSLALIWQAPRYKPPPVRGLAPPLRIWHLFCDACNFWFCGQQFLK